MFHANRAASRATRTVLTVLQWRPGEVSTIRRRRRHKPVNPLGAGKRKIVVGRGSRFVPELLAESLPQKAGPGGSSWVLECSAPNADSQRLEARCPRRPGLPGKSKTDIVCA